MWTQPGVSTLRGLSVALCSLQTKATGPDFSLPLILTWFPGTRVFFSLLCYCKGSHGALRWAPIRVEPVGTNLFQGAEITYIYPSAFPRTSTDFVRTETGP